MYKTRKKILTISVYTLAVVLFIGFGILLVPEKQTEAPSIYSLLSVAVFFTPGDMCLFRYELGNTVGCIRRR